MKVAELIDKLQVIDQDREVVVRGYEGGVEKVEHLELCSIELNSYYAEIWYFGNFNKHDDGDKDCIPAILIIGGDSK